MASNPEDYEARGITRDTWACISVGEKREVDKMLFDLAASGVPALLSKDAGGKLWHLAVKGGLAANPMAYLVSVRQEPQNVVVCPADAAGQHPQAGRTGKEG